MKLFHELMRGTGGKVVDALNEHGLSLTEMKALHVLEEADGTSEPSVKELGGHLAMSLPAASRTADALLQRGLVARREDTEDRRIKRLTITPRGREVLRELQVVRLAGVAQWADGLTPTQRDALHAALTLLHDTKDEGRTHA